MKKLPGRSNSSGRLKASSNPSFVKKALAFMIDLFVLNIFIVPGFRQAIARLIPHAPGMPDVLSYFSRLQSSSADATAVALVMLLMSLYALAYFSLSEYISGTTIGMALMSMKVVDEHNMKPGLFRSVLRNIYIFPFFPFILLWLAEPAFLIAGKRGQRLTEMLTRTRVLEMRW